MNRQEFENLYDRYAVTVALFLSGYTKRKDQLEDWVQIVFLKIWKYRDSVDADSEFLKTYLLKVARNVALSELSKKKRSFLDYRQDLDETVVVNPDGELYGHKRKRLKPDLFMEKYNDALDNIPPRSQQIYQLSREEGLSYKEIAQTLRISPKTVEVHISKALRILRKELQEYK
ncbi:MAG: sigma-70 family RNA polymerase sigma factor [Balneolaceae bacterium]|nr:sigma-70 family RNA polymerase sigma factor [Balneolaceae bacterium]